mmetsp:Transcript_100777/g.284197  ORF Transcript_100777/g.284197 Transcript_100777/m.284197 type:complete len:372 (+) Transcript_100777:130-1245(+)|eukprot:CAMPEP_0117514598 /NCGR_PEP_ID=MMETSP0784-20121206/30151_1 /TAXON_ID=39447 /ORGANISM="" /LENGTH=371 /DNA_ID=CAMNT_0005310397 /DNA_START=35 /DNA_END=1150 /DNA_ORIENTATION=+
MVFESVVMAVVAAAILVVLLLACIRRGGDMFRRILACLTVIWLYVRRHSRTSTHRESTIGELPDLLALRLSSERNTNSFMSTARLSSAWDTNSFMSTRSTLDSFCSCHGGELEQALAPRGLTMTDDAFQSEQEPKPTPKLPRERLPRQNSNSVSEYKWLITLLQSIVDGTARGSVTDLASGKTGTPLFVVAGGCPNTFCGMQAVVFSAIEHSIDFWWVKPQAVDGDKLEKNTLNRHSGGQFKNIADKAKNLYQPLADKFQHGEDGEFQYGVDHAGRAFIRELAVPERTMLIFLVWQESWSSPMARNKFIEGKLCYEIGGDSAPTNGTGPMRYYSRQYRIMNGQIVLAPAEYDEVVGSILPSDSFQDMYKMP